LHSVQELIGIYLLLYTLNSYNQVDGSLYVLHWRLLSISSLELMERENVTLL